MSAKLLATIAEARFRVAAATLQLALRHTHWRTQPRVPAGNGRISGQWTDGEDASIIRVQARPPQGSRGGSPRRIAGNWRDITPEQATRLDISHSQMRAAVRQVQRLDPKWRPRPSIYETVEGEISANNAARREAENRFRELQWMGIGPGPFAVESQPARGPGRNWTAEEIRENNRIGRKYGCHTCGTRDPGTRSGNYVLDHQRSTALGSEREHRRIFPQCVGCSNRQGGYVRALKYRYDYD
jgi:hypothetical protein